MILKRGITYVLCEMESLINKSTDKYICFHSLVNVRELETKDNYLKPCTPPKPQNLAADLVCK